MPCLYLPLLYCVSCYFILCDDETTMFHNMFFVYEGLLVNGEKMKHNYLMMKDSDKQNAVYFGILRKATSGY